MDTIKDSDRDTAIDIFKKAADETSMRYKKIYLKLDYINSLSEKISTIAKEITESNDMDRVNQRIKELNILLEENSHLMEELNESFEYVTGHENRYVKTNITLNDNLVNSFKDAVENNDKEQIENLSAVISKQYTEQSKQTNKLSQQFKFNEEYDVRNLNAFAEQCKMSTDGGKLYPKEFASLVSYKSYIDIAKQVLNIQEGNNTSGITSQGLNMNGIKRSSYKTTENIYTLKGNTVIVSNSSGKILGYEQLNSDKHKGFFQ